MSLSLIASVVGYFGFFVLWLQVVIGSRHLFKYITTDTVLMNRIHKWLGMYGTMFVFFHPLLEMMSRLERFLWIFIPTFITNSETYITLGRFAFLAVILVWVTSAIVREKIKWHPWKWIHILTYPIVILGFVHLMYSGTLYETYPLVRTIVFAMFVIALLVTLFRIAALFSLTKIKARIHAKEFVGDGIVLITLDTQKKVVPIIGQHIYVQSKPFANEHPFTVMEYNKESGMITLGIRKLGKFWDELASLNVDDVLYIDGPYGVFTQEAQSTLPKVIISGGIGVTPFVDLVRLYGKGAIYINCNRSASDIVRRDVLCGAVDRYVDVLDSGVQGEAVRIGRISKDIIKDIVGASYKNMPYFICGSPMFITTVVGLLTEEGVAKESIFYEELGF